MTFHCIFVLLLSACITKSHTYLYLTYLPRYVFYLLNLYKICCMFISQQSVRDIWKMLCLFTDIFSYITTYIAEKHALHICKWKYIGMTIGKWHRIFQTWKSYVPANIGRSTKNFKVFSLLQHKINDYSQCIANT